MLKLYNYVSFLSTSYLSQVRNTSFEAPKASKHTNSITFPLYNNYLLLSFPELSIEAFIYTGWVTAWLWSIVSVLQTVRTNSIPYKPTAGLHINIRHRNVWEATCSTYLHNHEHEMITCKRTRKKKKIRNGGEEREETDKQAARDREMITAERC